QSRGRIEASYERSSYPSGLRLHGLSPVAELKLEILGDLGHLGVMSPRAQSRGRIEAPRTYSVRRSRVWSSPRAQSRGRIEARFRPRTVRRAPPVSTGSVPWPN